MGPEPRISSRFAVSDDFLRLLYLIQDLARLLAPVYLLASSAALRK